MSKKDDRPYLRHILESTRRIRSYRARAGTEEVFLKDELLQDGIIRQTEIIGEAVKNLSADLRVAHSDVPWNDVARMRDKLIHHYFGVDLQAVWDTAVHDIPALEAHVESILSDLDDSI